MEERCNSFANAMLNDSSWGLNKIITFLQYQKERTEKGDITSATLINFVKALKLFCEMSDVPVSWKKITRGLPKVRSFANDRAPTIEEIRKMTEYPDRRMKSIVFTMASSGIGLTLKLGYVTTNTSLFIELLALLETPNPKNLHLFNIILVNIIK